MKAREGRGGEERGGDGFSSACPKTWFDAVRPVDILSLILYRALPLRFCVLPCNHGARCEVDSSCMCLFTVFGWWRTTTNARLCALPAEGSVKEKRGGPGAGVGLGAGGRGDAVLGVSFLCLLS